MKNYLIDELTFKKFVQKVKSSADGDQVTAVIKQQKNDRFFESGWQGLTFYLGKRLRSGKVVSETAKRKESPKQKNPSNLRQLRNGKRLASPKQKNQKVTTNPSNLTKNKPDQVSPSSPKTSQANPQSSQTQTSQTGTTASKRIRDMWTNLNEPISYSGNSAAILNKINSFK